MDTVRIEDLFDVDASIGTSDWTGGDLVIVVELILK